MVEENKDAKYPFADFGVRSYRGSPAIMKHVRAITTDPKKVGHSHRHSISDLFRFKDVPEEIRRYHLGHAAEGITDKHYGNFDKQLLLMHKHLETVITDYSNKIEAAYN